MLYYDLRLGAIALLLTLVRAAAIMGTSALRIHYENRHFNLQGKIGGLVLQLIAGVGKLRVANATGRALGCGPGNLRSRKAISSPPSGCPTRSASSRLPTPRWRP